MIFVTLGTQDKQFNRLIKAIDKEIVAGTIKEEVIVQSGYSTYESKNMIIKKMIPLAEFNEYVKKCNLLITHAGVGSIMTGLLNNKKVIAVARKRAFHEHNNDHQLQIAEEFDKMGYIKHVQNLDNLGSAIKDIKKFKPKKYKSNNNDFVKVVSDFIDNN